MKANVTVSLEQVIERCDYILREVALLNDRKHLIRVFGVPRGGALALHSYLTYARATGAAIPFVPVLSPESADIILDDIIDSGKTRSFYEKRFPQTPFVAVIDKLNNPDHRQMGWFHFPWEPDPKMDIGSSVTRMLEYLGEDPNREGLLETPSRVVKSWGTLFGGYKMKVEDQFKTFEEGACDELVVLRGIEFYSTCEHHMLPFSGKAHIGYIPNGKVVGVSKLARILEVYARRLQIQERIGQEVTAAIVKHLAPKGVACVLEAQHYCMTARGVQKQNSVMVTASLTGCFKDEPECRSEFYRLIGK